MVENIVVGRDRDDLQKFGQKGVAYIGKHIVGGLLEKWGLKPQGIPVRFFVPKPHLTYYTEAGIAVDFPFALPCRDMGADDWMLTFGVSPLDMHGLLISRAIKTAREHYGAYVIQDIIDLVNDDKKADAATKEAVTSKFEFAKEWGLFEKEGTKLTDLFTAGGVSVLDISHFSGGTESWSVKSMLVGMLSRRIYQERLEARKLEEQEEMTGEAVQTIPMAWMIIDEAHMFLPSHGETPASEPLLTLVKQGREPGISLVLITQRPNKLHEDALAQADLVISHRLTAQPDLEALRGVMQTYMFEDIQEYINMLPRQKGTAIILDDNSERIFTVTIRPRFSWHSGGSPSAIRRKGLFEK